MYTGNNVFEERCFASHHSHRRRRIQLELSRSSVGVKNAEPALRWSLLDSLKSIIPPSDVSFNGYLETSVVSYWDGFSLQLYFWHINLFKAMNSPPMTSSVMCMMMVMCISCVALILRAAAYKNADGRKIDNRRVLVDVERARTVKGWLSRRLGTSRLDFFLRI
jgi:hypothetical protein